MGVWLVSAVAFPLQPRPGRTWKDCRTARRLSRTWSGGALALAWFFLMPTAPGPPRGSSIQVLTRPDPT